MADEADVSQARMEAEEANRRKYTKPVEIPKGTGQCLWCDAPIEGDGRWCGPDCRTDWEHKK